MYSRMPRVIYGSMSYDIVSNKASAFTIEGTQSRCASSHELSIRGVTMSDIIDAEEVVEAVASSEANTAQTRAVAVSLAFSEGNTPENDEEVAIQQHRRRRRHTERNRDAWQ
jgi:hypothetical protein